MHESWLIIEGILNAEILLSKKVRTLLRDPFRYQNRISTNPAFLILTGNSRSNVCIYGYCMVLLKTCLNRRVAYLQVKIDIPSKFPDYLKQ